MCDGAESVTSARAVARERAQSAPPSRRLIAVAVLALLAVGAPVQADFAPAHQTTNATPMQISGGPSFPGDSLCRAVVHIYASDHGGNVALWAWPSVAVRRVDDGAPTMITGTPEVKKTLGATAWTASLMLQDNSINATVQGVLGGTIDWSLHATEETCMIGPYPQ